MGWNARLALLAVMKLNGLYGIVTATATSSALGLPAFWRSHFRVISILKGD